MHLFLIKTYRNDDQNNRLRWSHGLDPGDPGRLPIHEVRKNPSEGCRFIAGASRGTREKVMLPGTIPACAIMKSEMELGEFFMHFHQLSFLRDSTGKNMTSPNKRPGYMGKRKHTWRRLLKKHWPYVLAVVGAILLALLISQTA